MQQLITKEIEGRTPRLYATDGQEDPTAFAHFFCILNHWDWWMTEYDPETREAFGLVCGFAEEWGYFSIAEMESVNEAKGFEVIEREAPFEPKSVSECRRQ